MSAFVSRYQLLNAALRAKQLDESNRQLLAKLAALTPKPKKSIWDKLFRRGK